MNANDLQRCYRTLEVEPSATFADVKRSYRTLVRVWHPDRFAHEPALEQKAQEKLKQINLAFELLELFFADNASNPGPSQEEAKTPQAEESFAQGQKLFFGNGVAKDTAKAVVLLRKSAEMGFSPAQFLLGQAYYSGDGLSKNLNDAAFWWTRAAELLHPGAQYSLGCLYHQGHNSSLVAKVVKSQMGWQIGDTKIEAYKWLNLAITYGVGRKGGVMQQTVSTCLTEKQRNEARSRASAFWPQYPKSSPVETFNQLFDWFLEECESSPHKKLQSSYSRMQIQTGGLNKFKEEVRAEGVEYLRNTFLGDTLSKTSGFFKAVGSAWNPNRSSQDWGGAIARGILAYPCEYLSDTFIQQRENAINHIWLNLVRR